MAAGENTDGCHTASEVVVENQCSLAEKEESGTWLKTRGDHGALSSEARSRRRRLECALSPKISGSIGG